VSKAVADELRKPEAELLRKWGGVPVDEFDYSDPESQFLSIIDGLHVATRDGVAEWQRAYATDEPALGRIKNICGRLAGEVIKLAVGPASEESAAQLAGQAPIDADRVRVACKLPGTADAIFVALRDQQHEFALSSHADICSKYSIHFYTEIAGNPGPDRRTELIRKLWERVTNKPAPPVIDDDAERDLFHRIEAHARRDRRRYLLVAGDAKETDSSSMLIPWAQEFGLSLITHHPGQSPHLLMAETRLIANIREYLELLETL
jgi:hypothetical protein